MLAICYLCILTLVLNFSYGFEGWIWALIASVPGLCILCDSPLIVLYDIKVYTCTGDNVMKTL